MGRCMRQHEEAIMMRTSRLFAGSVCALLQAQCVFSLPALSENRVQTRDNAVGRFDSTGRLEDIQPDIQPQLATSHREARSANGKRAEQDLSQARVDGIVWQRCIYIACSRRRSN